MKTAIAALALGFALAGCATTADIDFDYDTGTDYTALKTYRWESATGNAAANELLVKRIRGSVDAQLAKKGRTPSADSPDFLIGMQISGKTTHGGSVAVGASVGIPVGRAGRVSVGGARSKPIEKTEGTLVLDFHDAKTKALVWQATASGAVEPNPTPEYQQKRIDDIVAQMLERFPPKK